MAENKRVRVESLVSLLETGDFISSDGLLRTLTELKILGRVAKDADPIYTTRGIKVLCSYAFTKDTETRREAQRCLANAMYLVPGTKKTFVEVGGYDSYIQFFKEKVTEVLNAEDDFLVARMGFLLSAAKGDIVQRFVDDGVLQEIQKILEMYVEKTKNWDQSEIVPLAEILKFLYNLTFHKPLPQESQSPLTAPLVQLLTSTCFNKFESPLTNVVHNLLNLPLSQSKTLLFPPGSETKVVGRIIEVIDKTIPEDTEKVTDSSLDENLCPVFVLLCAILEIPAPNEIKEFTKLQILPNESDRSLPLGQSTSLPSRLLRLTTNPFTQNLKETIFTLLYELADSSPTALVEAIGYGFASGYLFSHGIPVPENIQNAMGNTAGMPGETASRGSTTTEGREDVNPITGQKLEDERIPDLSSMTDEEKEREAERLFVLFERMRKLGVVNVENPIRTAQQSGRFEELD